MDNGFFPSSSLYFASVCCHRTIDGYNCLTHSNIRANSILPDQILAQNVHEFCCSWQSMLIAV